MAEPEKIYPATPHKRRESRQRGQIAKSNELNSTIVTVSVLVFLFVTGYRTYDYMVQILYKSFSSIGSYHVRDQVISALFEEMAMALELVAPMLLVAFMAALISNFLQFGFVFSGKPLMPQWSRIDPVKGLKRMFSMRGLFELGKSIFKIGLIGYIVTVTLLSSRHELYQLINVHHSGITGMFTHHATEIGFKIVVRATLAMLFLSIFDYLFQRWQFEQDIRMTREEMREEIKRTEGDPEIRRRIKQVQRELSQMRMMKAVPTADAIITNPIRLAIAIKYDHETMEVPYVVAKGERQGAAKIRQIATENNVPIVENKPLAQALYKSAEVGDPVPVELYQAVAEVLAYINELTNRYGDLSSAA